MLGLPGNSFKQTESRAVAQFDCVIHFLFMRYLADYGSGGRNLVANPECDKEAFLAL
jgi:hypothetical protein